MLRQPEFLPTTRAEMTALGWDEVDVLLVSGDAYVDSHAFGTSLLGRWLVEHGYRTGLICQPRWDTAEDFGRLGRPRLFAGISAGSVDSLIAHYTAFRKKRSTDAYSPGGVIGLRPNRAGIVYAGLLRQAFPGLPVVAGGIEASLRRASHYDFWSDSLRRSFVLDSKVDAVLYGMGERSILEIAALFATPEARERPAAALAKARIAGTAYAVHPDAVPADAEELPSHEAILADPGLLIRATMSFERQMLRGTPALAQRSGGRAVVFEKPSPPLTTVEMDRLYGLPFTRRAHPSYPEQIPAVAMLDGSVTSHRGCGGGCSFCALASHQGRVIQSRSEESVLQEVHTMAGAAGWKGSVSDVGGPTANMWGATCAADPSACVRESCLYPRRCRNFQAPQERQIGLLRRVGAVEGVGNVRVASGVRHDLATESEAYLQALVGEFTGGQLKIAPEHISEKVLRLMRKPPVKLWNGFLRAFQRLSRAAGKEQYVIPYLMSGFPGCTDADMRELAEWLRLRGWRPQQVQCFIPTPGTVATAMFYAQQDAEGRPLSVARSDADRLRQHRILVPDAEPSPSPRPSAGGRGGRSRLPQSRGPGAAGGSRRFSPAGGSRGGRAPRSGPPENRPKGRRSGPD
ncbi:MAG: YgiQ family radical SAM protein, partial [Planctomycetes bacterium]|nr:YgiQ family radical SAM protein [Planctomycetota bacterium]